MIPLYAIVAGLAVGAASFIMMLYACQRDFGIIETGDFLFFTMIAGLTGAAVTAMSSQGNDGIACILTVSITTVVWAITTRLWTIFE